MSGRLFLPFKSLAPMDFNGNSSTAVAAKTLLLHGNNAVQTPYMDSFKPTA
jgi:hypothetical protein